VLAAMAAAFFLFLLLPSLSPHYGFYSDELYYVACTKRLAFGYVDHPPFFPFVLRLHAELFGDSLFALRMLPAAAGALMAFLTGWMARRMGGGLFAQVLAALAVMASPQLLVTSSFFSVNCLEPLLWTTAAWIVLERCRSGDPRLWIALGLVLGVSFLTKHTTVVLIGSLAVATIVSPLRRDCATVWPWAGALVGLIIVSPNLYWLAANDWVSLDFYRRIAEDNIPTSSLGVLGYQIIVHNPASAVVWVAGLFFFLRSPYGRRFRPLGWIFLTALIVAMIGGQRRSDRIAGVFPFAFAGGAVLLEALRQVDSGRLRRVWNTYTLPSFMLLISLGAATIVLPVLPPEIATHHPLFDGGDDWRRGIGTQKLPYHLGNRTHWKPFVAEVEQAYGGLDPDERADTALEYYGEGLPAVYSPHTGYFLWGPPEGSPKTVIAIGIDEDFLRDNFEQVVVASTFRCDYCPRWQDQLPIRIARSPRRPVADLWPELGEIGGMDRYRRLLRAQESE
jgi:4-amino-4-deoxy-L-arabinose transferase-like glycosyltransferase